MPYPTNVKLSPTRKMVLMGLLIALALTLSYFERFIPLNFAIPGVKIGLANVITLISLMLFKPKESILIVVIRVIFVGLFMGSATSFLYSLAGGILSLIGMVATMYGLKDAVSPIGISVAGAFFHNLGQVLVLSLIVNNLSVGLAYFPILVITGLISGIFIGITGQVTYKYIMKYRLLFP